MLRELEYACFVVEAAAFLGLLDPLLSWRLSFTA